MSNIAPQPTVFMSGIQFGEQPRWHEGSLWFSDWGPREVIAVDLTGHSEVVLRAPSFPCCADWLPDGRPPAGNELVVDGRGNIYINGGGFNLMTGEPFATGVVEFVRPDGSSRVVASDLAFPNGMLVTPDNATLIVAESYAKRLTAFDIAADGSLSNRRIWAKPGQRRSRRHLPGRRGRSLVRRRAEQAVYPRSRGR